MSGDGAVEFARAEAAIRRGDALCAVMWANNVTGVIQPIGAIAGLCDERGVPFHVDGVQAASGLRLDVGSLPGHVTVAIAAHKLGGPKGVGALVGRGIRSLVAVMPGGGQELGLRSGTENVAGAVGLAVALELRQGNAAEFDRRRALRDAMEATIGLDGRGSEKPSGCRATACS